MLCLLYYIRLQESSTLVLKVHFPAEFHSNTNQTHLNKLIKVFRIESYRQVSMIKLGAKLSTARLYYIILYYIIKPRNYYYHSPILLSYNSKFKVSKILLFYVSLFDQ